MKDTLILKDGTAIELESADSLDLLQVLFVDKTTMVSTWDKLTMDNLANVQVKNGDGLVSGNYTDLLLVSETSVVRTDGSILTTYRLRQKTDIERIMERLAAVEEGQQVHDGAIADLGDITSVLAESTEEPTEGGTQ